MARAVACAVQEARTGACIRVLQAAQDQAEQLVPIMLLPKVLILLLFVVVVLLLLHDA
jgi:hypothetical protein